MFDLHSGMFSHTKILRCSLASMLILVKCVTAPRGNCSLDAAVTYTWNNAVYLFKWDKYTRWTNDDTIGYIKVTWLLFTFLSFTPLADTVVTTIRYWKNVKGTCVCVFVFVCACICVYFERIIWESNKQWQSVSKK